MLNTIAVLTGDIIHSRQVAADKWQPLLIQLLSRYGNSPGTWEIFRGDSFQLKILPEDALLAAIYIKAGIKQISALDVRLAIGIGEEEFKAEKVTTSIGSAFTRSGECFDLLNKQTMMLESGSQVWNETINTMLSLALVVMNNWTATVSGIIVAVLENPEKQQIEIASMLNRYQSNISAALKRGAFDEIRQMELFYRKHYLQA